MLQINHRLGNYCCNVNGNSCVLINQHKSLEYRFPFFISNHTDVSGGWLILAIETTLTVIISYIYIPVV